MLVVLYPRVLVPKALLVTHIFRDDIIKGMDVCLFV